MDYANVLEKLADAKIHSVEKTEEYYQNEVIELDETQRLNDNHQRKPRGVSEWLKVQSWKGCVGVTSPRVRISSPLPYKTDR